MYTTDGRLETPYKPIPGRVHPKEGTFLHRQGKPIKNADGRVIGHTQDDYIKKNRNTVCGLKDKMALSGSTAKTKRFVVSNGHVDRRIDEAPLPVGTLRPRRRRSR